MDPLHAPFVQAGIDFAALPILCEIEQMLIARSVPIMKVYRLRSGYYGFEGNVVNVPQDISNLVHELPRTLQSLPVVLVHRKSGNAPDDFVDFKVRPACLLQWLVFLKTYNKYYSDITISENNLQSLPVTSVEVMNALPSLNPGDVPSNRTEDVALDDDDDNIVGGVEGGPVPEHMVSMSFIMYLFLV